MVVHKKELNEKQIEFEGVVGSLKKKNAHLSEQRRCLLLGLDLKLITSSETSDFNTNDLMLAKVRVIIFQNQQTHVFSEYRSRIILYPIKLTRPRKSVSLHKGNRKLLNYGKKTKN